MIIDPGDDVDVEMDGGDPDGDDSGDQDGDGDDPDGEYQAAIANQDEDEAEYQAAMAKIRKDQGDDTPKPKAAKKPKGDGKDDGDASGHASGDDNSGDTSDDNDASGTAGGANETKESGDLHSVKINGVEKQVSTKELISLAQKSDSSEQRFQEGAAQKRQVEGVINKLVTDPGMVLDKLNISPEKIEQWLYDNHIAPQILEGDEKVAWERNKEFERLKSREAERDEEDKKVRQEQSRQTWTNQIVGALKAAPDVPQTDWSVNKIAGYMQRAIKAGFREITPEQVIPYVKRDWDKIKSSQLDSLDDDQMLEYLGDAGTEKVRRALLKKHKAGERKPRRQSAARRTGSRKKAPRSPYDLISR